jgi:HSP20 family protein
MWILRRADMARRHHFNPFWKEFDEMIAEMEAHLGDMIKGLDAQGYLPSPGFEQRMVPALKGEFSVDVLEHEEEVIVVADLPGVDKTDIAVYLIDPKTLEISSVRGRAAEGEREGYYLKERFSGSMRRRVELPTEVTEEGTTATFKNGILELRLKKMMVRPEKKIEIE